MQKSSVFMYLQVEATGPMRAEARAKDASKYHILIENCHFKDKNHHVSDITCITFKTNIIIFNARFISFVAPPSTSAGPVRPVRLVQKSRKTVGTQPKTSQNWQILVENQLKIIPVGIVRSMRRTLFYYKSNVFNRKSGFLIRKSGFFISKSGFFHWKLTTRRQ